MGRGAVGPFARPRARGALGRRAARGTRAAGGHRRRRSASCGSAARDGRVRWARVHLRRPGVARRRARCRTDGPRPDRARAARLVDARDLGGVRAPGDRRRAAQRPGQSGVPVGADRCGAARPRCGRNGTVGVLLGGAAVGPVREALRVRRSGHMGAPPERLRRSRLGRRAAVRRHLPRPAASGKTLPRVARFQTWNEPNLCRGTFSPNGSVERRCCSRPAGTGGCTAPPTRRSMLGSPMRRWRWRAWRRPVDASAGAGRVAPMLFLRALLLRRRVR